MPRGKPKDCVQCSRRHWSPDEELCSHCRHVFPSKRHSYAPKAIVVDHDLPSAPAVIRGGSGKCLGRLGVPHAADRRCQIHWRHLSHRHCPTIGCGRAMGTRAKHCGGCSALELFERWSRHGFQRDIFAAAQGARSEYAKDLQGLIGALSL